MSFELLSGATTFATAFFVIVGLAFVLAAVALTTTVTATRRERLAQHRTVREYYSPKLAFSH